MRSSGQATGRARTALSKAGRGDRDSKRSSPEGATRGVQVDEVGVKSAWSSDRRRRSREPRRAKRPWPLKSWLSRRIRKDSGRHSRGGGLRSLDSSEFWGRRKLGSSESKPLVERGSFVGCARRLFRLQKHLSGAWFAASWDEESWGSRRGPSSKRTLHGASERAKRCR